MLGTIKDDRPNSKTVLKGRLTPSELAPVCGGDATTAQSAFTILQEQGVLNKYGRITDIIVRQVRPRMKILIYQQV